MTMPKPDENMPLGYRLYGMQTAKRSILATIAAWEKSKHEHAISSPKDEAMNREMYEMYRDDIRDARRILLMLEKGELKRIYQKLSRMDSLPRDEMYEALAHVAKFRKEFMEEGE